MKLNGFGAKLKTAIGIEGNTFEYIKPMLGYNSASILFGGGGYIISLYFLSYLTEVEGLDSAQAGLVILFAQIWDAITDPAMGIITDRTRSKYGRHRRYLLWGVLPIAFSYFCLWNSFGISGLNNPTYTMIYYIVAYLLYNTAYTLVCVPHTAMLPEIAPGYFIRTQYNAVQYLMNSVGMTSSFLLVSLSTGFVNTEAFNSGMRTKFMFLGLILCLWFSLPLLITFKMTKEPSSLGMRLPPMNYREPLNEYRLVFKNKAFRQYFLMSLFYMMAKGFYSNADQYFIKYIAKRWDKFNIITSLNGAAEASGFPLNYWLTKRFGKQFCGKLLTPVMILGIVLNAFVTPKTGLWLLVLSAALYNIGFSGPGFVNTNIQPDVTDVDELITGRRREGVIATFSSFIKKTVSGFMASIVGFVLKAFGFVTGQSESFVQSASAVRGINLTFIVLPVVFMIFNYIMNYRYKMTGNDLDLIRRLIKEKKETGKAEASDEEKQICEKIAGQKWENMWIGQTDSSVIEEKI